MTSPTLPQFIGLCGKPTCGKTTTAEILEELYGYKLVDDGGFLRQIAMNHFGATWDDVHTQEGKLRTTVVAGVEMTWRDVLGRIGNGFEHEFGPDSIPELAYRGLDLSEGKRYVFGSVRREQGAYHKSRGALILEIDNGYVPPSPYEFDTYNRANVDVVVANHYQRGGDLSPVEARLRLRGNIDQAITNYLRGVKRFNSAGYGRVV